MRVDHNECNNEIQPILISIAFGPAIPSWRDGCDGAAIPICTAIPDGQPWRDVTSRDSKHRDDHYLLTVRRCADYVYYPERILLVTCNTSIPLVVWNKSGILIDFGFSVFLSVFLSAL
ncbi:hypothetical protein COCC4DRAFT_207049 [Bipolaris maydis ATCC 48331]|uniref:Uncharacterized protein n=1 Tax=Cochliobolus heterostrophus (strain C4 / ATCC 48331 / race T) TaxID=665024 RepID=N4WHU6_COCH4|nr:uncharacterized protein COCC4DRAFT_207049 [Bipolaris maydis ATCC 48331]ENH99903.1 hypothetical protein COCC4DRAFT_207049 [Bipolaris maydis ATCC 48331]